MEFGNTFDCNQLKEKIWKKNGNVKTKSYDEYGDALNSC